MNMREYPILHLDTNVNEHERNNMYPILHLDTNVNEHETEYPILSVLRHKCNIRVSHEHEK